MKISSNKSPTQLDLTPTMFAHRHNWVYEAVIQPHKTYQVEHTLQLSTT